MIFEKLVLSLSLLIIYAYVARYLGPQQYGVIAYSITLLSISVVISNFGTNTLIFQKISKNHSVAKIIIPPIQILKTILYIICTLIMFFCLYIFSYDFDPYLTFGLAVAFYFQAIDSYTWYNDAKLKSKYNSLINTIALIVAILSRYYLVKLSMDLKWFAIPYVCNYGISFLLKRYFYIKEEKTKSIKSFIFEKKEHTLKVISYFIISGAPLFLSEISILIYTRLTNLYLGQIKDIDAVGIFNASYVLATAWTVVPLAFVTSVFTIIYKEKDISNRALIGTFLTLLMLLFGFLLVILCYFFKRQIISIVYGSGFELSSSILPVLILGSVFSLLGVISYRMIISMHGYKYIAKKMVIMGVISIPLNYYLIKSLGIIGAAYATVSIELISATLANYFFKGGVIAKMHFKMITSPYSVSMQAITKILK